MNVFQGQMAGNDKPFRPGGAEGNGPAPVPPAKTLRLSKNRVARPERRLRTGSTPDVTAELLGPWTTLSLFGGTSQAIARALDKRLLYA